MWRLMARTGRFRVSASQHAANANVLARRGAGQASGAGRPRARRRGSAVVELAIVTPLLLTMVFGVMEFGWVLMIRESLTNATREATRVRVLQGSTDADAQTRFADAMRPTGLTVAPTMLSITQSGDVFTVTATVPYSQVTLVGIPLGRLLGDSGFTSHNIAATCSMRREGV